MSLRLKFNLSLLAVMLLGLGISGYLLDTLLKKNAREEVTHEAGLLMESALAIRAYTVEHVRPRLDKSVTDEFVATGVPAFAASETMTALKKKYPEYAYKEATLNPTNPKNLAEPWEAKIVEAFRQNPATPELSGVRITHTGPSLYVARPMQIKNGACLACHSQPEAAPASLVKTYGSTAGFGWQLNEVVGAQVVSVPMAVPLKRAQTTFYAAIGSLVALFLAMFVVLNLMLERLVIRPITRMSAAADAISMGKFDAARLDDSGTDEVGRLAQSFNRMSTSLGKALQMLRAAPKAAPPAAPVQRPVARPAAK